jgi:Low psii accumulation1 / Rep27
MAELKPKPAIDPELLRRLKAEARSPYRGLRQFVYVSCAASGAIGGVVFLFKVAAGRDLETNLPNLALQAGVVAVMVWLLRIDRAKSE